MESVSQGSEMGFFTLHFIAFVFEVVIPTACALSPLFVFDCLRADDMAYRDTTRRGTA